MRVPKYSLVFTVFVLFLLISFVSGQTSQNVNLTGRWAHGLCQAVFADSSYAFIGNGATFQILDLSEPSTPVVLGETNLPELILKIVVHENYAYVANGYSGLRIVDISNFSTPTEVAVYAAQTHIADVAVSANYAYITAGDSGLRIIDIANPLYPSEISSIYPSGSASFVEVDDNFAYVSIGWSLRIINISDPYNPSETGYIDVWTGRMEISGNYAYVTDGSFTDLHIINISDPANPVEVGSLNTPGWTNSVAVHGIYAYVANGDSGLRVIDISDPENPQTVVSYHTPDHAKDVALSGKYAYVADRASGLQIIEVINPTLVGSPISMNYAQDVVVSEGYAFVANHVDGLTVFDISNPASPFKVDSILTRERALGITLGEGYIYIADGDSGLTIVDISNPVSPSVVGGEDTPGWAVDVAVDGNWACIADQGSGLRIFDVSNPANPSEVGFYLTPTSAIGVDVRGNYAYVADAINGLRIIDISNPTNPSEVGFYDTAGDANDVIVHGDVAYVADYSALSVIDISNPFNPNQIAYLNVTEALTDIVIEGAYVVGSGSGLLIFDITIPENPKEVASYQPSAWSDGIAVQGTHAYLASYSAGLEIVNLINPAGAGFHNTADEAYSIAISGNYAYVAERFSGMHVLNIANPVNPVEVGYYNTPGSALEIALQDNYAYVADGSSLRVVNISNPSNPQETGFVSVYSNDVALYGNYAYTLSASTIYIIDISTPASPTEVGSYTAPDYAQDITIKDNYAYVACSYSGLRILDISTPTSPVEVGFYETAGSAEGVAISGNYAYVADNNALRIIDISNPALPVEKGSLAVSCFEVTISGDYACISHQFNLDFQIIDVSDPKNPQAVGHYDHGYYARGLAIDGANVYLTHGAEGIYVLRETIPPFPATNLTAGGSSPSPWQNNPGFLLDWENPGDMSGISQAKYKIGTQPLTSNDDFSGILPGTSPQTVTVAQEGSQSLYLWLVDGAGNEDYQNFSTVQVRYDASISLPTNVTESHGVISDTWQNSVNNPTFFWTAPNDLSGIDKYYLYFGPNPGGGVPVDSTSNTTFGFSGSEGISYFRIQVKDNAGNIGEWTTAFIFKYDNTAPTNPISVIEIGGALSDVWQGDVSDPNFTWSGASDPLSGIASYWIYIGQNINSEPSIESATPAFNPGPYTNGTYYLRINVEDEAGNHSPNMTLFIFKHDALPPENPTNFSDIVGSENDVWQNSVNDPNFTWDPGNDPLSGIQGYKYYWGRDPNGVSGNMVTSPGFNPAPADTGILYLRISTVDRVGNSNTWFTAWTFKFDNITPTATATSNDTSGYLAITVSWLDGMDQGGSGLAKYHVRVRDGVGSWEDWLTDTASTTAVYTGEHGHTYSFEVAASDHAENKESFSGISETSTVVDTLTTDVQPPGPPISLTAGDGWQNTPQFSIDWTNPQDENGIVRGYYKLSAVPASNSDYTGIVSGDPPHLVSATGHGGQDLYLWLEDGRGNVNFQNYAMVMLRYDGTRPTNSTASSPDTSVSGTFTVNWSGALDNGGSGLSGRYDIRVREDQGAWSNWLTDSLCTSAEYTGKQGHIYYFESLARDNADNLEQYTGVAECSTFIAARLILSLSQIQGEYSDQVQFNYDINNHDNSLTDISCEYALSSTLRWNPATVIGNTIGIQPQDYQGTITWDSYTDAPGVDVTTVRFKITPSDFNGSGSADSTGTFHLDNNRVPSVSINPLEGEQSGDASISYQLTDQEQDTLSIYCEFLYPGSQSWLTATTTGYLTDLTDYASSVIWNSVDDLPEVSGLYQFRIRPFDNDLGIMDTITIFIDNAGAPDIVSISELKDEQSDDITIYYDLTDDEGDNISLICKYSEDSGINWNPAMVSGAVSDISPANYKGSLTWNSVNDLPGIDKTTVRFQIIPNDGNPGLPMETDDFHLDNNLPPSVQISPVSSPQSGSIFIPIIINDAEEDTIQITGKYQIGSDVWKELTFSGKSQFISSEYVNMLEWKSVNDIGFGAYKVVRIQLIPVDKDSGTVSATNTFDIYNYAGDYTADLKINFNDLVVFAKAWQEQDLTKEIGPAEGEPPLLIPKPDNKFDFEDLMVLVQQWNWSYNNKDSLAKGTILSKSSKNNFTESEVTMRTLVDNNKTKYLWEKEIIFSDRNTKLSPLNKHLLHVSQSNYDLWSNEFGDELTFTLDSTAQVLGLQLELEYDPKDLTVSEFNNYFLHEKTGFTFKNADLEGGKFIVNTVVLEEKEKQIKNKESLFRIKFNPIKETQTVLSYRWIVYNPEGNIFTQGNDDIQLTLHKKLPKQFALYQNFPNPFNPSTTIRYQLPEDSKVQMEIFNILGERVTTLVDESQKAGYYTEVWDISNSRKGIASGIYFVRFVAMGSDKRQYVDHKKVIVLK